MHRVPIRAELANLRAAGEAVRDDDRFGRAGANRRHQHAIADRFRYLEVTAIVTERTCHPAASRVENVEAQALDSIQQLDLVGDTGERLLMAMAMKECIAHDGSRSHRRNLASKELIEQHRAIAQYDGARMVREQRGQFVAESQD